MVKISIVIDVVNSEEIVNQREGRFKGWLAKTFLSKRNLKKTVESHMAVEVVKGLQEQLPKELEEQGVKAEVKVSIDHDDLGYLKP